MRRIRLINRTGISVPLNLTVTAKGLPDRKIRESIITLEVNPFYKVFDVPDGDVDVYLAAQVLPYGKLGNQFSEWGYRVDTNALEFLRDGGVRVRFFDTQKLFTNQSPCKIGVTLVLRKGGEIGSQGIKEFVLNPSQSDWHDYGSDPDLQLNGIKLAAVCNGTMLGHQSIVVKSGSDLDNLLNKSDGIDFGFSNNAFFLSTRKVS